MQTAVYARVSTSNQVQTQTIDQKLERLHTYTQAQEWTVPLEQVFRDDGYSGATLDRPALSTLHESVRRGAIIQLCITAPDRLARNYAHQVFSWRNSPSTAAPSASWIAP